MSNNRNSNKMLIDATHPEETRVVVLRQSRVEEFDYESAARKLLRGNIYLAKVTRVEPSLQAAFVDYGGNRHGFLAFNEIHPDYYQIPVADRRALIEAEAAEEQEAERAADAAADARAARRAARNAPDAADTSHPDDATLQPDEREQDVPGEPESFEPPGDEPLQSIPEEVGGADPSLTEPVEALAATEASTADAFPADDVLPRADEGSQPVGLETTSVETVENGSGAEPEHVESVGSEDALEELPSRPRRRQRVYKIQEVIKRRQVILVQVVKEERGTKGAALTTYLSLAGRYTVLMPNTARGGGISRKITNPQDRKRLKAIAEELEVPEGMGLIIRTAGAARTKQEIKRDFDYLLRLWESVRELALQSNAPALVYEEGNLIKRSIRDLYGKEVEEIIVAGEEAHREAKDFMRMLLPSHAKNVILYEEPEPLFSRYQIERQLNAMFSPYVHLRSGGYLVMNQTEALVSIDVNSGKATREFSIEETALNTNLEASDEIARQLKLRDLAGLIVIDFIDMEEKRNNRAVERRIKDALRNDRARIQVGRISHFGLLEMSRQRLRTGVLEGSTTQCPHCQGTGIIRSTESVALAVIRGLEDALMSSPSSLAASTTASVALYILNNKRSFINEMEARYGVSIAISASDKLQGANYTIEKVSRREEPQRRAEQRAAVNMDWGFEGEESAREESAREEAEFAGDGDAPRSRRRRRRRGRRDERPEADSNGHDRHHYAKGGAEGDANGGAEGEADGFVATRPDVQNWDEQPETDNEPRGAAGADEAPAGDREESRGRRGRRRGRRGGRRGDQGGMRTGENGHSRGEAFISEAGERPDVDEQPTGRHEPTPYAAEGAEVTTADERGGQLPATEPEPRALEAASGVDETASAGIGARRAARTAPVATEPVLERVVVGGEAASAGEGEAKPARRGWWQRKS